MALSSLTRALMPLLGTVLLAACSSSDPGTESATSQTSPNPQATYIAAGNGDLNALALENLIKNNAKSFFEIYTQHQDFAALMDLYAENAELEDIIYGNQIKGRAAIKDFLNWSNPSYKISELGYAMVVQNQVVNGNVAVTEGYFTRFNYYGQSLGPWRFVIWLTFNEQGKIQREVDWINYTPRKSFLNGRDMNELLPKDK